MSASIEKFFWSESEETQKKVAEYLEDRTAAFSEVKKFIAEVGAEQAYHSSNGAFCGVEFKGKTPAGWTSKSRYMRTMPERKTAAGKALYKRAEALRMPIAKDYFIKGTVFENYEMVIVDGNSFSFPTASIAMRVGAPSRVLIRCRMLVGEPPKRKKGDWCSSDTQYESDFILPAGYSEWKEWEMLRFADEFNAAREVQP